MRFRIAVCVLALVAPGLSAAARADEATDHYNAGAKAVEEGDLARAIDELRAAVAIEPSSKALLMLGNTYAKVGQLDEARAALKRVLELDSSSKKRAAVEKMIVQLGTLGRTHLLIGSTPPGATVYVDLKAEGQRGKTPLVLPVPPGRHRVILELEGYEPASLEGVMATEGTDVSAAATLRRPGCDVHLSANQASVFARVDGGAKLDLPATTRVAAGDHQVDFAGKALVLRNHSIHCDGHRAIGLDEDRLDTIDTAVLAIHVTAGARVLVDGAQVASEEAAHLVIAPGAHRVEAIGADGSSWRASTVARAGEASELTPELALTAPIAPLPTARPLVRNPWFWGVLGAAVVVTAGVAVGLDLALRPSDAAIPSSTSGTAVLSFH